MSDPTKTFTIVVGKKLLQIEAATPMRAVFMAYQTHPAEFKGDFNEVCVFEGTAPECIYKLMGIYVL